MRIGIDMLGIQSPDRVGRESTRIGLRLVRSLLERHFEDRFVLYGCEGRPTIQEVLDQNPDGLDWLIRLDPFDGRTAEPWRRAVKVVTWIADAAPDRLDDRRLAMIRDHDAILAASEEVGDELAERAPTLAGRIVRLGLGIEESWIGPVEADRSPEFLDELGIVGPFLFANLAAGASRSNLGNLLEAYSLLPTSLRDGHQLVIAGESGGPWSAVKVLQDRGCAEGLVLVGRVDDRTLRLLYERSAAFVSPSRDGAPVRPLVEAMAVGAAVVAGRSGSQPAIIAGAGLLADSTDPAEIAGQIARLLTDDVLNRGLRRKAVDRARDFPWDPVVDRFLADLGELGAAVADWGQLDDGRPDPFDGLDVFGPSHMGHEALLHSLARRFATVHVLPDVFSVKPRLKRLRRKPGLAYLLDETSLDRIESCDGSRTDVEGEVACQRLFELFLTRSCLAVRSARAEAAIRSRFPEFAGQVGLVSSDRPASSVLGSGASRPDGTALKMTGLTPLSLNV